MPFNTRCRLASNTETDVDPFRRRQLYEDRSGLVLFDGIFPRANVGVDHQRMPTRF